MQGCCSWQSDCATARESRWFFQRRCALKAQGNESLTRNGVRAPVLGRQTEFPEAFGAPGQVVPKRPAGSSVSPITRSETNLGVNVEESGPVRADEFGPERGDEFGPTDADEDVVQEAEELKHVLAPFCPPKLKWNRTTFRIFHFEDGALRVSVVEDFHLVIGGRTDTDCLCGSRVFGQPEDRAHDTLPVLIVRDRKSKGIWSHPVPSKGVTHPYLARALMADLDVVGYWEVRSGAQHCCHL